MMGLPSLHALDEYRLGTERARIWLASEATDMRCGFDRLAERVRGGDRGGSAERASVRFPLAARRSLEDS